MTIKEGKDKLRCKILAQIMNTMDRPYFLPADLNGHRRFLMSSYKASARINMDLKKSKLTLNITFHYQNGEV